MKRHVMLSLALFLGFTSAIASASPKDPPSAQNHVLPVLVDVNAKGDVTSIAPGYELHSSFTHLLRDALQKMITKPAVKDGKPVSSRFVVNLALVVTAQDDGKSTVSFKYLSSKPLPPGSWHWIHTSNDQLALASQNQQITMPTADWYAQQKAFDSVMGLHANDPILRGNSVF